MPSRNPRRVACALAVSALHGGCFVEETPSGGNPISSTAAQPTTGDADDSQGYESGHGPSGTSSASSASSVDSDSPGSATQTSGDDSTGSADADDSSGDGGSKSGGVIDVTLSGCDVDLGGTVVVSYNGSLGVASVYDSSTLTGSFQFDLDGLGMYALSSQHRIDTATVVNLSATTQGTWTNLDANAIGTREDAIGGMLTVAAWDPAAGISELVFENVSLLNLSTDGVCTIDGVISTTQLYP